MGCEKTILPEENKGKDIQSLYGEYFISDIHWTGLPVDLNSDGKSQWNLKAEFQEKIGYYEPYYSASIERGHSADANDPEISVFNVVLPYPFFFVSDGEWICSSVRNIHLSLKTADSSFILDSTNCAICPNYQDDSDLFLSNILGICVVAHSYEDSSFEVRVHCRLPYEVPGREQVLNDGYIYYTFSRTN